ncbi:hypothetical protein ACUHMQ_00685 [Chitinimonas sp. PSY-7]|uniref:hypothetical protein n=1 Tax=Chitinimonas sp. PSY-7 TaxID=3459088 RepID=UPI0040403043
MYYDETTMGVVTFVAVIGALTSFSIYCSRTTRIYRRTWQVCSVLLLSEVLNGVLVYLGCLMGIRWLIPVGLLLFCGIFTLVTMGLMHSYRSYRFASHLCQRHVHQLQTEMGQ